MSAASVIIATRNKARYLELTLASYALQSAADYEILVADDGSSDDTEEVVRRAAERVPVRYLKKAHGGRAHARNHAIREAQGRVIIFSDDDRLVAPGFVAAHLARVDGGAGQVFGWQNGIISFFEPDLHLPPGTLWSFAANHGDAPGARFTAEELVLRFESVVARFAIAEPWWEDGVVPAIGRWGDDLAAMSIPWALGTTGNLSVPRQALLDVGGLDDGFKGWGLEDLDLCYRLFHAGLRPVIDRDAVNYHQAHRTGRRKRTEWLANLLYLLSRHPSLDLALYARELTQNRHAEWERLDAQVRALAAEPPPPILERALRDALVSLVTRRARALESSGFLYFLGVSQADW